ncbi:hypothetical protein JG687_00017358 [Phytophthora cactorum]|uniref:Uncharacterized protein n=1 Tax=Phytophthora cactorum TaxID=29920 RepID=A0A8T1TSN7_9STRA|nr:hypothetical protein JG687_00017358 [Phytophthora cactorum]
MPRLTIKQRKLRQLREIVNARESAAVTRDLLSEEDTEEDDLDEPYLTELEHVQATRYGVRALRYRRRKVRWLKLLYDHKDAIDVVELLSLALVIGPAAFVRQIPSVKLHDSVQLCLFKLYKWIQVCSAAFTLALGRFLSNGNRCRRRSICRRGRTCRCFTARRLVIT